MKLYGIIGAGGFGKEVMPLADYCLNIWDGLKHESELVFVVEDKFYTPNKEVIGHRVMSLSNFLSASVSECSYNIAIGNSRERERIANSIPCDIAKPFSITAQNHVSLNGNKIIE